MRRALAAFVAVSLCGVPVTPARADAVEQAGDVLQIALPALALGLTVATRDLEGAGQLLASGAFTTTTTLTLKYAIDAERPKGGGLSFPSGHTAAAFAGASFVARRYGWRLGLPAYAAASFVAFSRVDSRQHHVEDVLAAAAIAIVSTHLFVRPRPDGVRILPAVGLHSGGLVLQALW